MIRRAMAYGIAGPLVFLGFYLAWANWDRPRNVSVQVLNKANFMPIYKARVWFDDRQKWQETDRNGIARIDVPWQSELHAINCERPPFRVVDQGEEYVPKLSVDHVIFLEIDPARMQSTAD